MIFIGRRSRKSSSNIKLGVQITNNLQQPPPPPSHTHTLENKETKYSTRECKKNDQMLRISDIKNVNKRKNRLTPVKLESKKRDKKILASR